MTCPELIVVVVSSTLSVNACVVQTLLGFRGGGLQRAKKKKNLSAKIPLKFVS